MAKTFWQRQGKFRKKRPPKTPITRKLRPMADVIKIIVAGQKNLATTILGFIAGFAIMLQEQATNPEFDWSDWRNWLAPVTIAALGYVAKNAHNSGKNGGNALLIALSLYLLPTPTADAGDEPVVTVGGEIVLSEQPRSFSLWDAAALGSYAYYRDSEYGMGVRLSYDVMKNVTVRVDYQSNDFESGEVGEETGITVQLSYPFDSSALPYDLKPYIIVGSSVSNLDDPNISAILGAGISAELVDNISVFVEYQFSSEDALSTSRLGVAFSF